MRRLLIALCLALPLAGCIDADVTVDFKDTTNAEVAADIRIGRQLFDMMGKSAAESCPEGTHSLTAETYSCATRKAMTIDEMIAESQRPRDGESPEEALRRAAVIERLEGNRLRVSMDFSQMGAGRRDAEEMKQMAGMMRAALAGHSLIFRIRAPKVVETTGTLAADGKSAEFVVPLTAMLDAAGPGAFVTTVELQSCRLWVFC